MLKSRLRFGVGPKEITESVTFPKIDMELVSRLFAGLLVGVIIVGVAFADSAAAVGHQQTPINNQQSVDCNRNNLSPSEAALCGVSAANPGTAGNDSQTVSNVLQSVVRVLSWAIGVIAVIVILVQGLRLVISGGSAQTANSVRNGIIFAGAGLVIAILAPHIVGFFVSVAVETPPL